MKKILTSIAGALLILAGTLAPLGHVLAANCTSAAPCRPYLKATGADVFTGGWFAGSSCTSNSPPGTSPPKGNSQDPFYSSGANKNFYGGIQTYANASGSNSAGGASSQYGAFSLGQIQSSGVFGFYSSGATANPGPANIESLSFSNNSSVPQWGGMFQGATPQLHCIPDYYNSKKPATTNALSPGGLPASSSTPYFASNAGNSNAWDLVGGKKATIQPGDQIIIFVDGDVWINNDITYANNVKANTVPRFALVVQGNIFIDPNVSHLDGLYIAEPHNINSNQAANSRPPADDGVIWTCHPQSSTFQVDLSYPLSCNNNLTINGAVIAKQIHLLRSNGDLAVANSFEDGPYTNAINNGKIAEVFNFTPEMVIGGPYFPGSGGSYQIQSLVYLPPVF